ncbi:MAG TPA: YihY/virulence factor BrkB family protein [Actinomycetota bacterium]
MGTTAERVGRRLDPALVRVTGIDVARWRKVLLGVRERSREERLSLVAAGIAFWGTLALFPTLIVLVTVYGLASDVGEVQEQVDRILGSVSPEARTVVGEELESLAGSGGLGWGLAVGLVGVLWTASSGMASAIKAVAFAYGEEEQRPFLKLRALALAFTAAALAVILVLTGVVAVLPLAFDHAPWVLTVGRWVVMILLVAAAVAALYRFAPQRRHGGWEWAIKAALAVAVGWAALTAGFSVYARSFANFTATYGALTGVIVLMVWFYLTGLLVIAGAAIAAEMWRVVETGERTESGSSSR